MSALGAMLDNAEGGRGGTVFLAGEGGIGKTRLARTIADRCAQSGWTVALGSAYPVETGVPYALFSDALLPILAKFDSAKLALLTRGGNAELAVLFPALAPAAGDHSAVGDRGDPAEFKARLLWNFTQFLARFAAQQPLLLILENLQWADSSSLELLHFVARQLATQHVVILCTYNDAERDQNAALRSTERSLVGLGAARVHPLEPLTREETSELVGKTFGVEETVTREFTALLYDWTRGNPFFMEETLKALVEAGRLHEHEGTWLGWELRELDLPRSIREAILARVDRLPEAARSVANLAAVIGTRTSFDLVHSVTAMPRTELLTALDVLRRERVLIESTEGGSIVYDFAHPLIQQTLYGDLGLARGQLLHATVAEAMEAHYGEHAHGHAGELAFHFARSKAVDLAPKAVKYLWTAGKDALATYANREAADYLGAALDQIDRATVAGNADAEASALALVLDLARARLRLGEYDAAHALLQRARIVGRATADHAMVASIERRMGLACYWSGRYDEALELYEAALASAEAAGDDVLLARVALAKGSCLQELGRPVDAQRDVERALSIAERLGDRSLLARVHRALLLLHAWTGPAELAREHGVRAIALAGEARDLGVACTVHWALAMVAGLTGNATAIERHLAESERIADELRSPLLRLWTAEIAIEYASGRGDWESGIALAEQTIALARTLGQRTLLPRLLVWSALIYLGRGDVVRAKAYIDESWRLAECDGALASDAAAAGEGARRPVDVHAVVPAHTGLAAYYLAIGDHASAIRIGEQGLAIADRTGYVVWAIHRLVPIMAEAALWSNDTALAERLGERLRRDSVRLEQKLGLAWADACDALVAMQRGESDRAMVLLRAAIDALEAIPFVADAARLRRRLALALAETGDRDGAMRELRRAHDVFVRLGAMTELDGTRGQLRELGARPPVRSLVTGAAGLTGREVEIARLVVARRSNKEIAQELGISPRTVSTHLSNIFGKLGVGSRGELAEFTRRSEISVS